MKKLRLRNDKLDNVKKQKKIISDSINTQKIELDTIKAEIVAQNELISDNKLTITSQKDEIKAKNTKINEISEKLSGLSSDYDKQVSIISDGREIIELLETKETNLISKIEDLKIQESTITDCLDKDKLKLKETLENSLKKLEESVSLEGGKLNAISEDLGTKKEELLNVVKFIDAKEETKQEVKEDIESVKLISKDFKDKNEILKVKNIELTEESITLVNSIKRCETELKEVTQKIEDKKEDLFKIIGREARLDKKEVQIKKLYKQAGLESKI